MRLAEKLEKARAQVVVKPVRQVLHGERITLQKVKLLLALSLEEHRVHEAVEVEG